MLNKKGWGILEAIVFLIIFIVCLLFSFWGLKKLGLLGDDNQFKPSNEIKNEKEEEKEFNYTDLENSIVISTKAYINDFYNNDLGLDTLNIKVSQLIDNGYIKEVKDENNKNCSGYVSVYKENNENIYKGYIKCKKYETNGYEERKDD